MSDETIQLLTSSEAGTGYLVGVVALLAVALWSVVSRRTVPAAGAAIAAAGAVALDRVYDAPTELIVGLALLFLAGLVPLESDLVVAVLAIPGAAALGLYFVDSGQPELIVLVVAATVLLGPLVGRFDQGQRNGDATLLLVISYLGVLVIVPDTDLAIVIAAAALPLALAGPPLQLAHLGRGGALAATGLLMWTVATGGSARTSALVAGVAALGILIADPLARLVRDVAPTPPVARAITVAAQGVLCLGLAVLVGSAARQPVLVAVVAAAMILVVGLWSTDSAS